MYISGDHSDRHLAGYNAGHKSVSALDLDSGAIEFDVLVVL